MSDYFNNCPKCGTEHRVNMYGMGRCPSCKWESNRAFPEREAELNANWSPPVVNVARPIKQIDMTFTTLSLDEEKSNGYNGRWTRSPSNPTRSPVDALAAAIASR